MKAKIRGIIFDLDDTLFDCTGQLTQPARRRAAQILASAHPALSIKTGYRQQVLLSQTHGSSEAIRILGAQYNIPPSIVEQALNAYNPSTVETITLFPDVIPTLTTLVQRGYQLALVTSGNPDRQREKVRLLGLCNYFSEGNNTLILHDDRKSSDKESSLIQAAKALSLPHAHILCVGDKLTDEIATAKTLGMATLRMRQGRQKNRKPQNPPEQPDIEIDRISQLLPLLP
ncbi:MAG: HAD hydrolase-like protein [Gemmatimonadota bacterium]|nr:HAD hydrolase-like protein [Gemmatimonadota bacterium]MDE2829790.1 HAD hydrolase-like protein [Gemmatimonadota bacterium]